jgi:hypothetical protein
VSEETSLSAEFLTKSWLTLLGLDAEAPNNEWVDIWEELLALGLFV